MGTNNQRINTKQNDIMLYLNQHINGIELEQRLLNWEYVTR